MRIPIFLAATSLSLVIVGCASHERRETFADYPPASSSSVTTSTNQSTGSGMNESLTPTSGDQSVATSGSITNTNTLEGATSSDAMSSTSRPEASSSIYSSATNQADSTQEQLSPTGTSTGASGGLNVTVQGSNPSDQSLGQQITQQLRAETSLTGALSGVQISINEGKVTLTGSVRSEQQKQDVESALQHVAGVSSVDNQLQVSSDQSLPNP